MWIYGIYSVVSKNFEKKARKERKERMSSFEEVINFWFGDSLEINYKTKWFPTSSKELQKKADEIITLKFSSLLSNAINHQLNDWLTSKQSTIALILVLDQFSRHIYRSLPSDAIERQIADKLALEVAEQLIKNENWDEELKIDEFVFCLMPFRHSATLERLQYVLQSIDKRAQQQEKYSELLQKFRKQTLRRLQHLQDRHSVCNFYTSFFSISFRIIFDSF